VLKRHPNRGERCRPTGMNNRPQGEQPATRNGECVSRSYGSENRLKNGQALSGTK
jgi:hypothetical protein